MTTSRQLATILALLVTGAGAASAAQQAPVATPQAAPSAAPGAPGQAEIYYNYMMGHYYAQEFQITSRSDDANKSIDFYKKAFALDSTSQQIGDELAEIYFQSQHIRDAVTEAQSMLSKDPDNLGAHRLLARIYVRTLGEMNDNSPQRDTIQRAIEQYREIVRLDPEDSDASLWLARLYRMQNEADSAESVLRTLLKREPENENGVEQLTQLLLDEGKAQDAIQTVLPMVERAPSARLWDILGSAYLQAQDMPKAEEAYRKSVEAKPDDINHRRDLAQTLLNAEKYPEALEQFQRLVEMNPDDPENYLRLAEIHRQMKHLDKAEANILLAEKLAPGNLEVIYYESSIYEAEGRYEDSIRVLSEAVAGIKSQSEFTPSRRRSLAILYQQLGQIYRETGNYTAAVNTFEEMLRLGPEEDRRARTMIIEIYREAREIPKALEAARKAVEAYPKDRAIRITQALLYGENGQTDEAASALRGLLDGSSSDFEIQMDLGQVYEQGHRWAEAEQAAHAAEKVESKTADREMAGFLLGAIFERQKKYDLAEEEFRKVLAVNPGNTSTLNYYGYMLADRGIRLDEAVSMVQRALADEPDNAAYQDSLGWAYYKQNKLPEAEEWLRKAAAKENHDPTILSHLGDVYSKMGKDSLAESQYQKSVVEWRRVMPADLEPAKLSEVEQKIAALKHRAAQQKSPAEPKP